VIAHGGDIWRASEELAIPATELLDFSANINPRGLPVKALERLVRDASDARLLSFYPDPSARRLREALGRQLMVDFESVVVGPGAEALLGPILRCLAPPSALVPVPAFSEYRRVCAQAGIAFAPFALERSESFRVPVEDFCRRIEAARHGVVLLNNPHNPSGATLQAGEVRRVVEAVEGTGATLVLDEAFIDYVPAASLVREAAARPGLIVVRSLTKFYGCPALRVGYAVAHPETSARIASLLPTWPVTQLAIDALIEAIADREYGEASLAENVEQRERLAGMLSGLGLTVFPSSANYLLIELAEAMPRAAELRARLLREHRILIRNCDSYEGLTTGRYVRVAVRTGAQNDILIQALGNELRLP
jgi:threonine-phosphate decarboxylase